VISPEIFIEGVAQNPSKSGPNIILIELFDSHYRSVILAREPAAALAAMPASPAVIAVAVQDFQPCPTADSLLPCKSNLPLICEKT